MEERYREEAIVEYDLFLERGNSSTLFLKGNRVEISCSNEEQRINLILISWIHNKDIFISSFYPNLKNRDGSIPGDGDGFGFGDGSGFGDGYGSGTGSGRGSGYGTGAGSGDGCGTGRGYESGNR